MASFSSLLTQLTGAGFYYTKPGNIAQKVFNQESNSLYRNQPRLPFEYYISLNLNQVGAAKDYIDTFFTSNNLSQIAPLVKSIDMPSMKIDTISMNQYNRRRLGHSKISFEPIKVVMHDVADGKTLKFWDMYYRYYFQDGDEPGFNTSTAEESRRRSSFSFEVNPSLKNLGSDVKALVTGQPKPPKPVKQGIKAATRDIITPGLENNDFGYNLDQVGHNRNLINSIEIFQVHGGRFNQVTLVNPRVVAFTHDTLNYASDDRTLELTFTFEYEYAYYNIQNMKLGGDEPNNNSSKDLFEKSEFVELPALAFNAALANFLESNNPLLDSDNPLLNRIGRNTQNTITNTTGAAIADRVTRPLAAGALDGLARISPKPASSATVPSVPARNFGSTATPNTGMFNDAARTRRNG